MLKISKPAIFTLSVLALVFIVAIVVDSCKTLRTSAGNPVIIDNPKDSSALGKTDHFIPKTNIDRYLDSFKLETRILQEAVPSLIVPSSETFNKRSLLSLLKEPGCAGIRIYHGIKGAQKGGKDELRLILVGVDTRGEDILIDRTSVIALKLAGDPGGLEHGQCPTCQN